MAIFRYSAWAGLVIIWLVLLLGVQFPLRKKCPAPIILLISIAKMLLATALAYAVIATDTIFSHTLGFPIAALYVAVFGDAVGDVVLLLSSVWKKERTVKLQASACTLCTLAYFLYGTINMQTVSANRMTIVSEKLSREYTVAFVSDMHVGSSQSMNTTENTIRKISLESPDLIILGGDIVDEYTTKEEMERVFSLFGELDIPVYFIYGNHDRQPNADIAVGRTFTPQELESTILKNNIHILKDEWVNISDDLVILGREDYSSSERLPIDSISARPENAFVLQIDHSPYIYDEIEKSNSDLQISGHTHAAQFFPLQFIYGIAGYDAYGFYRHGNTDVYVSSGASGWRVPFRTEGFCHYEIITLKAP